VVRTVERVARAARLIEPGGYYHVTARGNNGEIVYRDDLDREAFELRLARTVQRFRWRLYAYCLMSNHYHLVVEVPGGLSQGMCELNGGYARRTNVRHGRSGHLFRNRFYSGWIADDSHLLEACRYVVLNPKRAGICRDPADWRWSSYRTCAGIGYSLPYLATHDLLRLFAERPADAHPRYRAFIAAAPDADEE
jgi:putative transposase